MKPVLHQSAICIDMILMCVHSFQVEEEEEEPLPDVVSEEVKLDDTIDLVSY